MTDTMAPSGLNLLANPVDSSGTVDIVAVHGLGGHPTRPWTTHDGVCWLRDFLPRDSELPNSRVLVYGYSSGDFLRDHCAIERHADTLLLDLVKWRAEISAVCSGTRL